MALGRGAYTQKWGVYIEGDRTEANGTPTSTGKAKQNAIHTVRIRRNNTYRLYEYNCTQTMLIIIII